MRQIRKMHEAWAEVAGGSAYDLFPPFFEEENVDVPFESLFVGQSASMETEITKGRLLYFARACGDWNPAHMKSEGIQPYGRAIAHGLFGGALISALIASKLPGPGSVYESQTLRFLKPAYIGDKLITTVVVKEILDAQKQRVSLDAFVKKIDGEVVMDGLAVVRKMKKKNKE